MHVKLSSPQSRAAQARLAAAVRSAVRARSNGDPGAIKAAEEEVSAARQVFEAERFLARLAAAVAQAPELTPEQRTRVQALLVDLS